MCSKEAETTELPKPEKKVKEMMNEFHQE